MKKAILKKGSTAQKAILAAVCFACALSVSACGKRDNRNENKDPITGADQSQTNESNSSETGSGAANGDYSAFDAMIGDENTQIVLWIILIQILQERQYLMLEIFSQGF